MWIASSIITNKTQAIHRKLLRFANQLTDVSAQQNNILVEDRL